MYFPNQIHNGKSLRYVNEQIIREYASDILGYAHVYVCGPPPMMEKVISCLKTIGIKTNKIHYERFAL